MLAAGLAALLCRRKLRAELSCPASAEKGRPAAVRLTLRRPRALPVGRVRFHLAAENTVTGETACMTLPEGESAVSGRLCGCLTLRITGVTVWDTFSLLPVPAPCRARGQLCVMPDTFPLDMEDFQALRPRREGSVYDPGRRGTDRTETFQVRDYAPGDSLRQVHWKLSGKTGRLVVRDPARPVDHRLTVLVLRQKAPPPLADAVTLSVYPVEDSYLLQDALSRSGDDTPYRQGEAVYRQWVYDHYLTVPQSTYEALTREFAPESDMTTTQAKAAVLAWLSQSVSYRQGASVSGGDIAAAMAPGGTLTLTEQSSHAWTEYYLDGVGWLPFDAAPGYTDLVEYRLPVPAYAADDGRIALLAVAQDGYVIEPEYIGYRSGDTVKDVLKNSGHTFSGIDSGFITAVDGRTDNYSLHYDGDGYALDASAKGLTAIWFTTNANQNYGENLLHLAERMAAYNTSTNGLKDYAAAKEAYDAAHSGFYAATNAAAAPLPSGKWIKELRLGIDNQWKDGEDVPKFDETDGGATFWVPDYSYGTLYPYMVPGDGIGTAEGQMNVRVYLAGVETLPKYARSWQSKSTVLTRVLPGSSLEGGDVVLEARYTVDGYEQYQPYTLHVLRTPSLTDLVVSDASARLKAAPPPRPSPIP